MVTRIDNQGASYGGYVKEANFEFIDKPQDKKVFFSRNVYEAGKKGISIGGGEYLHTGEAPVKEAMTVPKDVERYSHVARTNGKSRLEIARSVKAEDDPTIIEVSTTFTPHSGQAELVVRYSNNQTRTVKASNTDVVDWLRSQFKRDTNVGRQLV